MAQRVDTLIRELRRGFGSDRAHRNLTRLRKFVFAKYREDHEAGTDNGWFELVLEDYEFQSADDH